MKIKVLKAVHLVAPDTNDAVQPEDKGKTKTVKNSSFWIHAQSQGFVRILDDGDKKAAKKQASSNADEDKEGK